MKIRSRLASSAQGQATVELVLAMPVVILALLLVLQVGLVGRSQLLVADGAREGARAAAVGGTEAEVSAAVRSTPGLDPRQIKVDVSNDDTGSNQPGDPGSVRVTVRYRSKTDVAMVGSLLGDVDLDATVVMRREDPSSDSAGDAAPGPDG